MDPEEATDGRGALRHVTEEAVVAACRSVERGRVISLNLPMDQPSPPPGGRSPMRRWARQHNELRPGPDGTHLVINDDVVEFGLQGSSQWDALAHFGVIDPSRPGVFYGDRGLEEVYPEPVAKSLGVEHLARGIAARGVLVDLVAALGAEDLGYLPDGTTAGRAEVELALERQGLTLQAGDAVLIFTGFERRLAARQDPTVLPSDIPGIDGSTIEIWEAAQVCALISDNISVEAARQDRSSATSPGWAIPVDQSVHRYALRTLGIPLGELWALDELASACRETGRYDFLLVSAPLNIPGAFGSPANALAIL